MAYHIPELDTNELSQIKVKTEDDSMVTESTEPYPEISPQQCQ